MAIPCITLPWPPALVVIVVGATSDRTSGDVSKVRRQIAAHSVDVSELRIPKSPIPREFATIIHGAVVIAVLPLIAVAMIAPWFT